MPVTVQGSQFSQLSAGGMNGKIDEVDRSESRLRSRYAPRYPRERVDYTRGAKDGLHDGHATEILRLARFSEGEMVHRRHDDWKKVDRSLRAYIPLSDEEKMMKKANPNTPVSIVLAESHATLDTFVTYLLTVFGDMPIFRYSGLGPEDTIGAILLEKVIEYQTRKGSGQGGALMQLMMMWRDSFAYGFGAITTSWVTKRGKRVAFEETGFVDTDPNSPTFGEFIPTGNERILEERVVFEGNELTALDPYACLPDPTASITDVDNMTFFGWRDTVSWESLKAAELEPDSIFFNVEYLRAEHRRSSVVHGDPSDREPGTTQKKYNSTVAADMVNPIDRIWMYVNIIPKEWKVGDSEAPELWLFCLAGDDTLIAAGPTETIAGKIPVGIAAPYSTGHEQMPTSLMDLSEGIQDVINYYANSRILEVRKTLKGQTLYDPKSVRSDDIASSENGGLIRTRRAVWGRGVSDMVIPFPVSDVTSGHTADIAFFSSLGQAHTGAADSARGVQRSSGERVTAREFLQTNSAALSRLQKSARVISHQAHFPIAHLMALNTQQFMDEDIYVAVAGHWEATLRQEYGILDPEIRVSPFDIIADFDIDISDGTTASSQNPDAWIQLLPLISSHPELLQTYDITRIVQHIITVMGEHNAADFLRKGPQFQTQVLPDEEVAQQEQAGNLRSIGGVAL